jgi:hypothetical protein
MKKIANCQYCGARFITENYRNHYCSAECKIDARNERKRRERAKRKRNATQQPVITIDMMMDAMVRLSIQYGDVQTGLVTGKLVVKDGVIVET